MTWCIIRTLMNFEMPGFRKVESDILAQIQNRLPEGKREAFKNWLSSINFIQRVSAGREINFYCMRDGKPHREAEWQMSDIGDEILVELNLKVEGSSEPVVVALTGAKGIPLSLESEYPLSKIKRFEIEV